MLTYVAGVAERVATGLRPDGQPMRLFADRDRFNRPGRRIDVVNDIVKSPRQPELLAVGADIAHVGAATSRDRPGVFDFAGGEADHRDAPLAVRRPARRVRAAIGDIELLAIAARVEPVRADAGRDEIGLRK